MTISTRFLFAGVSSLGILAGAASAQQVFTTNVIVQGSACIGIDCVSGESFGFDTLRLKENNLRIGATDTSTSASFPSNDWQLTFNDSSNGGANKFSVDDISGGRTPFTIEAGARTNALYVEDGGRIGVGTATPVVNLHVVTGNTPTLRLDQDGSSGFTPQVWDVAGNEAGFFVRDATSGSRLPFRILPGAASQALVVAGNSNVGIGAGTAPAGALHVRRGNENVDLILEQTSGAVPTAWTLRNNATTGRMTWTNGTTTPFKMSPTAVENLFRVGILGNNVVDIAGNLVVTGTVTTGGPTCAAGCDAVFDADYPLPTIGDHTAQTYELGYLPNVGPTLPGQPLNLTEKMGGILNELEYAHLYIAELNTRITDLEAQLVTR